MLKEKDRGPLVMQLQELLVQRGYPVAITGVFDRGTRKQVELFQAQHLDQHGQPLVVDGRVGPLTMWSLTHEEPAVTQPAAIDFEEEPPPGGSAVGRAALTAAMGEISAGAREIGGDDRGPFVAKYLAAVGLPEGNDWCAAFACWCFDQAAAQTGNALQFETTPGARALLREFRRLGWSKKPTERYVPEPGDLVFWWRVSVDDWRGHVGLVHQVKDGMLYTIEGNKSTRVAGFSYVLSRMEKLLGFGHYGG